jgi:hypothetical protein
VPPQLAAAAAQVLAALDAAAATEDEEWFDAADAVPQLAAAAVLAVHLSGETAWLGIQALQCMISLGASWG